MPLNINPTQSRKFLNNLISNFIRGVIVATPLLFTLFAVLWLFNTLDNFLPNTIQFVLAIVFQGKIKMPYIPGLGIIAVIVFFLIVGYFSKLIVFNKLLKLIDKKLEKTPAIKFVYTTLKDLISNLSGSKKKFDKPVLIPADENKKIFKMGFITQQNLTNFQLEGFIAVYIPMSFSIAGSLYFVPKKDVILLEKVDSAMAMKFIISGGVSEFKSPQTENLNQESEKKN